MTGTGSSYCFAQDPADGYYRVRPEPGSIDLSDVEVLIGYAQPCQCHGHSSSCDRETGICHVSTYACWGICNWKH